MFLLIVFNVMFNRSRQSTADDLGLGEWRRDGRLRSPRVESSSGTVRRVAPRSRCVNADPVDDGAYTATCLTLSLCIALQNDASRI